MSLFKDRKIATVATVLLLFSVPFLILARNADWIILRKYAMSRTDYDFIQYLIKSVPWYNYREITIDYPDIRTENREDPRYHNFKTVTNEDKIVIFQKIK
jgi:hypothetical protein